MKVIYYYDEPPESFSKSIFLAGPSPRTPDVISWRKDALRILEEKGYDGIVFVPEPKPGDNKTVHDWSQTPLWEHKMLDMADVVLFWVPRDMTLTSISLGYIRLQERKELTNYAPVIKLPGLTTNVEFGHWANSGKAVLGIPYGAPDVRYLKFMADKFHVPVLSTLEETIDKSLEMIGSGALRVKGEREIPYFIWKLRTFQNWYQAQLSAGNRLDGATVEWIGHPYRDPDIVYMAAIRASVYIAGEDRNKINEFVLMRPDISSVVLYNKSHDLMSTRIVLVKEFRSPATTPDGFIWELPGGSTYKPIDPLENAVEELQEEVGLTISKERLEFHGSRQLAGTVLSHKCHLYSASITEDEINWLYSQKGIPHGADYPDNPTGERAYTAVVTLAKILYNSHVDWSNVGMILSVLSQKEETR